MTDTRTLIKNLKDEDWSVAARAAELLTEVEGNSVTSALLEALDAHDTAITDAAMRSLMIRDDPAALEPAWVALNELDDDVTDQMWDVIVEMEQQSAVAAELAERELPTAT